VRELFQFIKPHLLTDEHHDNFDPVRIGVVSISDRASSGVYQDKGIPALKDWLGRALRNPVEWHERLIPDDRTASAPRCATWWTVHCDLVLTTGGTGPAPRDVTPEATLAVADKVMPGFGEQMRQISLAFVPTAILSRQVAVIRGKALIINLPGQPKAIAETLQGLPQATPPVHGIFAAVPYCIDLIGGPYLETDDTVCKAFRPKSAISARPGPDQGARATSPGGSGPRRRSARWVASSGTQSGRRQFARARADSFSIACHSSAIWCSWPEALSIRPFIACATGSSPCVTP
jgi:molybdopterin adenylyltransferase